MGFFALTAVLAWSFLFALPLSGQSFDELRAALAGRTASPDFPALLAASADKAPDAENLDRLFEKYLPYVKEGEARRNLLLRWAVVLELSGRWDAAAARYEEAAFAWSGQRDVSSLLSAARAWLAAGETEKALTILRIVGVASSDAVVREKTRVLEGWAKLVEGSAEAARALAGQAVSAAPDRETLLSALTLLWAASEGSGRAEIVPPGFERKFPALRRLP